MIGRLYDTPLRAILRAVCLGAALLASPQPASADFHLWQIKELYSNVDGSIQYLELFTSAGGQTQLANHQIAANSDGTIRTFVFDRNLAGNSANQHLLIATPGFAALPGAVAPDYVLPCGPFFDPAAASIVIDFPGADTIQFSSTTLPVNGADSLTDTNLNGAATLEVSANSPTNYAGAVGALSLASCQSLGNCEPCDDGLFCNGAETCSNAACVATPPCAQLCDEDGDACIECFGAEDCDDSEPCTADICFEGACQNPPIAGGCDDGLFCTFGDTCQDGVCVSGVPGCEGPCNEAADACIDCDEAADCEDDDACTVHACNEGVCETTLAVNGTPCSDDDLFCNGPGECVSGLCDHAGNPCDPELATCDEDLATCVPIPEPTAAAAAAAALLTLATLRSRRAAIAQRPSIVG